MLVVRKGSRATAEYTNFEGDVPADAGGAVTIEVLREDGTVVVAAGAATTKPADSTGVYRFTLTPAHTAQLDVLVLRWSGTFEGTAQTRTTRVEVAGDFYFTVPEAREADPSLQDQAKVSATALEVARRQVEAECEEICGVAFVRRYRRETLDGDWSSWLQLGSLHPRQVLGIVVDGVALTGPELADVAVYPDGRLERKELGTFAGGSQNVVVTYEHGYDYPPFDLQRATLTRLRSVLAASRGTIPDRALSFTSVEGGTFSLATPGRGGSETGIPDVDVVYKRHSHRVPGIA